MSDLAQPLHSAVQYAWIYKSAPTIRNFTAMPIAAATKNALTTLLWTKLTMNATAVKAACKAVP